MYLLLIAQRTLDKLLPHYSCLSLMALVCLQQHISSNEETESPGWPSLLLSGMQHGVVLEEKKNRLFLDKIKPEDTFQENNYDLATNWQSVCGNRLEKPRVTSPQMHIRTLYSQVIGFLAPTASLCKSNPIRPLVQRDKLAKEHET